jgi:hypothetical protein
VQIVVNGGYTDSLSASLQMPEEAFSSTQTLEEA